MPRPAMTFILLDAPENIHKRKQELTLEEIKKYQDLLRKITEERNAPVTLVHINQRDASSVAEQISSSIKAFLASKKSKGHH